MQSFEPGFIEREPITQNLLRTIRLIGEYKGKQELFKEQSPQVLETLRQAAIIQSTESSNRIEGIIVPLERIKELVAEKTTPRDRERTRNCWLSRCTYHHPHQLCSHPFHPRSGVTAAS